MDLDHGAPHRIKLVQPEAMPCDKDFIFIECGGEMWLALRADRLTADTLEECWATYRQMAARLSA